MRKKKIFFKRVHGYTLLLLSILTMHRFLSISKMECFFFGEEVVSFFLMSFLLFICFWNFFLSLGLFFLIFYISHLYSLTEVTIFFEFGPFQLRKVDWSVEELSWIYDQILFSLHLEEESIKKLSETELKRSVIQMSKNPEELLDQICVAWSNLFTPTYLSMFVDWLLSCKRHLETIPTFSYDWELVFDWKWITEYFRIQLTPPVINWMIYGVNNILFFQYHIFRGAFMLDILHLIRLAEKGIRISPRNIIFTDFLIEHPYLSILGYVNL